MPIGPGARVGPYEVTALLGEGGMGKVWRARHLALKRDDALKVLPEGFAVDRERVARFQREAEILASLNHPNIATIHGLEEDAEGRRALVLELVEGPTLADRIRDGAIPIEDALPIARQVADALEAAHEHGIIHRDLKPANIKITPEGVVKVLDFGLAKALEGAGLEGQDASQLLTHSPTLSGLATGAGVILGTAAYMSPEQAKGRAADRRSDVWAFGCVLFEMLTGTRLFGGGDVAETLALVLTKAPDWTALPVGTPASVGRLLRRCLERDRRRRLADMTAVRLEIEDASSESAQTGAVSPAPVAVRRRWRSLALPVAAVAILAAGMTAGALWRPRTSALTGPPTARFSLTLPEGRQFTLPSNHVIALSPDGARIAYVADNRLWLRTMGDLEARPLAGDGSLPISTPVFSPDGQSLAFFTGATVGDISLKKIGIHGGTPVTICPATVPFGASWSSGAIYFGQDPGGILRVSPNGGMPEVVVRSEDGEVVANPWPLAGGQAVLFTVYRQGEPDSAQIVAQSVASGERRVVIEAGADARYLPTGHLVYAVGGVLFAVRFDPQRVATVGGAAPVVEGVRRGTGTSVAQFGVSITGSLVYVPGPAQPRAGRSDLALVDRTGQVVPLKLPPGGYSVPRLSPDGARVAYQVDDGTQASIWIYELSGKTQPRRLTLGSGSRYPTWSGDGRRVTFQSDREGDAGIFWQLADGSGPVDRLTTPEAGTAHVPDAWSPDGQTLLFEVSKESRNSLWRLSLRDKKVERLGQVEHTEAIDAVFSPDGRWIAYDASNGGGPPTIFVEPFPPTGPRYQVTVNKRNPFWWRDDRTLRLVYAPSRFTFEAVAITTQPSFGVGPPVPVPRGGLIAPGPAARRNYDRAPDAQRIIGLVDATQPVDVASTIQVVLHWFEELRARVP
jgi:serine/threonine-protein kinase